MLVSGYRDLEPLRSEYAAKEDEIAARLAEFRRVGSHYIRGALGIKLERFYQ